MPLLFSKPTWWYTVQVIRYYYFIEIWLPLLEHPNIYSVEPTDRGDSIDIKLHFDINSFFSLLRGPLGWIKLWEDCPLWGSYIAAQYAEREGKEKGSRRHKRKGDSNLLLSLRIVLDFMWCKIYMEREGGNIKEIRGGNKSEKGMGELEGCRNWGGDVKVMRGDTVNYITDN